MRQVIEDVKAFHKATDTPILDRLAFPPLARIALRHRLIREEYTELMGALETDNIIEAADGIEDLIYVLIGTALEYGIPLERVWDEVQRSNMAKVDPETGKASKRSDGKVIKPEGWTPPDIARALGL